MITINRMQNSNGILLRLKRRFNMLCSRCKKRIAVVFITRMDGEKSVNEGICLQCAKDLNI